MSPFVFPIQSFYDINGRPLVGGRLYSFETNSDTPQATYTNPEGTELNENPIVLNERGECRVYIDDSKLYRFVLKDSHGNTIWSVDKISSASAGSGECGPVSVEGTTDQIKVTESVIGGVKHFVVGLSGTVTAFFASVQYNIRQLVSALANKKDKQNPLTFVGSTVQTVTRIAQDANGRLDVDIEDVAFPDWTSSINTAFLLCEQKDNKKTSVTGNEGSNTYYPTIKALVDYLDSRLQNLGGKKITNNGVPFTTASQLPTTTPYYGQNINSDDYAYVQDTGLASRYTAIVTGSSVVWSLDYEIALPVFTAEQQAAIDSGVTAEMLGTFLTKTGDGSNVTATFTAAGSRTNITTGEKMSVIFGKIAKWFADLKAVAFTGSYSDLSGTPTIPTVNNGELIIRKNLTEVARFGANSSVSIYADITVPTKTSNLTNDSGYITGVSWNDVSDKPYFASVATSGNYSDLNGRPTLFETNVYENNVSIGRVYTSNGNSINFTVPTKISDLENDTGVNTKYFYYDIEGGNATPNISCRVNNTANFQFKIKYNTSSNDGYIEILVSKGYTSNTYINNAVAVSSSEIVSKCGSTISHRTAAGYHSFTGNYNVLLAAGTIDVSTSQNTYGSYKCRFTMVSLDSGVKDFIVEVSFNVYAVYSGSKYHLHTFGGKVTIFDTGLDSF